MRKAIAATRELLIDQVRMLIQTKSIRNPHPYLSVWLTCRKMQGEGMSRPLPESGGVLDQDYMTTWAFEIIDEADSAERQYQQEVAKNQGAREALRQQLMAQR